MNAADPMRPTLLTNFPFWFELLKLSEPVNPLQLKNAPNPIFCTDAGKVSFNREHFNLVHPANACTLICARLLGNCTSFAILLQPRNAQWFTEKEDWGTAGGNAREAAPVHCMNALEPMDLTDEPKLIADNAVHNSNAFEPMLTAPPSRMVNVLMRSKPENARMPMVFTLFEMTKSPTMWTPAVPVGLALTF